MRRSTPKHAEDTLTVGEWTMTSTLTEHNARCVGEQGWVVSFLPGRTLTAEQALAAMRLAEFSDSALRIYAEPLGMTAAEAVGYVAMASRAVINR